jgi:hypothetical protein
MLPNVILICYMIWTHTVYLQQERLNIHDSGAWGGCSCTGNIVQLSTFIPILHNIAYPNDTGDYKRHD